MLKPTLIIVLLSVVLSTEAFQPSIPSAILGTRTASVTAGNANTAPTFDRRSSEVHLKAPKKKPEPEKEKIGLDAMKLFTVYMNPTRNPNSIFVYMLTALYFLGKYSESTHLGQ